MHLGYINALEIIDEESKLQKKLDIFIKNNVNIINR